MGLQMYKVAHLESNHTALIILRCLTLSPATLEIHDQLQAFEALHVPKRNGRVVFFVVIRG
jgi:2-polyprenyl-6-methoxyphenol hydroxylase-like FAD-dependent oxidoreductase